VFTVTVFVNIHLHLILFYKSICRYIYDTPPYEITVSDLEISAGSFL